MPSPPTLRALAALNGAFGANFTLCESIAPRQWVIAWTDASGRGVPSTADCCCDERMVSLIERAVTTKRSCHLAVADDRVAVAAPLSFRDRHCAGTSVAIVEVDPECSQYAESLADAVLRELRLNDEVEMLRAENLDFLQQVTDDFEELSFLRTMAAQLLVKDAALSIVQIVESVGADLRNIIRAKSLYFVRPAADGRPEYVSNVFSIAKVANGPERVAVLQLAQQYVDYAAIAPCVNNNIFDENPVARDGGIRQFLMIPTGAAGRDYGWFIAINRESGDMSSPIQFAHRGTDEFGTWEASLLNATSTLIASHASNVELIREKDSLLTDVVRSLISALDSKDAYTRGHSERVALFCKCIAQRLGYDDAASERLYLSGLLHDVGKIGVSDAVLHKPDRLNADEFAEIKNHPEDGWGILRDLTQLHYVLPGVLHHHEHFDGTGYPDGLSGEEIPLDGRVMAVADAYDAMTSDRAYRVGMPHERAVAILTSGAGSQWDPSVVSAFLSSQDDIVMIRDNYRVSERPARARPTSSCEARS